MDNVEEQMEMNSWGEFATMFGATPRNRILEFFLEMRELDFSVGDIARETGLNRATTYNTIEELSKLNLIKPTRKVSGAQLYQLNGEKEEVKILITMFNVLLDALAEKYKEKIAIA